MKGLHSPLLLCRPDDYDVRYKINPWMDLTRIPAPGRAKAQWQNLHDTLAGLGADIHLVPQTTGQPDMVFTANAGLVHGKTVMLAKFRHKERQGEEAGFRKWFEEQGYSVFAPKAGAFEGEGDALFATPDLLFAGFGFRSDRPVGDELGAAFNLNSVVPCELVDPRFYHLDTCFAPVTPSKALVYLEAFTKASIKEMEKHIELIVIPSEDAEKFACNAVVLGTNVVVPAGCQNTEGMLQKLGFTTHSVELDEFLKAGGAAKCLTLFL